MQSLNEVRTNNIDDSVIPKLRDCEISGKQDKTRNTKC